MKKITRQKKSKTSQDFADQKQKALSQARGISQITTAKKSKVTAKAANNSKKSEEKLPTQTLPAAGSEAYAAPQKKFDENNPFYHIINQVVDPEIGVGIADMGIIYDVQQKDNLVEVIMTLTSMGCPAGPQITTDIDAILRLQDGVDDVHINVVWEPAWTPEMMKPELKAMLFGG